MNEIIDIYDNKNGNLIPIGMMEKHEAETKGMWHKISRVHLIQKINNEFYVILQRRGRHKRLGALNFAIAVSEHVLAGESDITACIRGVSEELGINMEESELKREYNLNFIVDSGDIKERTYNTTYIAECNKSLEDFTLQKSELEGIYLVPIKKMVGLFEGRVNNVEAKGLRLSDDETEYIEDTASISTKNFTHAEFYKEDFLKLYKVIENMHKVDNDR
jgi:isopentenyldiphosphate isomerase